MEQEDRSANDRVLYRIDNILDILIRHIRAGRQAHSDFEECLGNAVNVAGSILVDRLPVHGFPKRAGFDAGLVEDDAQGLDIVVRLAVSHGGLDLVHDTGSPADRPFHDRLVRILLSFDPDGRVDGNRIQPEIGIVAR